MNTKTLEQEIEELKEELSERDETISELKSEIRSLENENIDLQNELDNKDLGHCETLSLDTFYWKLEKGNLRVQQRIESFIEELKAVY